MPLNLESLDDEPLPDGTPNFAGGLWTYPARNMLAGNQFFIGRNTMLTKAGVLQTRRGTTYLGTQTAGFGYPVGMGYLETAAGVKKLLLCHVVGSTNRVYDGATGLWTTQVGYTANVGANVEMAQGIDKLYLTNPGNNMHSWDGTTFTSLGSGATDAPVGAKFIVWGTNRLIAACTAALQDTVFFSDILDPSTTHWAAANRIRVGAGDGEAITGIAMFSKTILAVFKRTRIFLVDINPSVSVSTFVIDEVPGSHGCVNNRTIAKVGTDLWFLSNDGVRSLARTLQGDDSGVGDPISLPVANVVNLSTDAQIAYATAVVFGGKYLLSQFADFTAADGMGAGYYTLSYNLELKAWEGRWDGWSVFQSVPTKFGGILRLVMAGNAGNTFYWRQPSGVPEVAADYLDDTLAAATDIPTRIGCRAANFGADRNTKQGFALEVEFDEGNTATAAVVKLAADGAAAATLDTLTTLSGKQALTLLHQEPFRDLAVEVSATSKRLAVQSVKLSAFLQTMPVGQ